MIRTETQIFIQRLNLEIHNLLEYVGLLELWNEDDNQDEVLLSAQLDVIDRIDTTIKEMQGLQSHGWFVVHNALGNTLKKTDADSKSEPTPGSESGYCDIGEDGE